MANLKNTKIDTTGFLTNAVGTSAQRPTSPQIGMARLNTDRSSKPVLEFWDGTEWVIFGPSDLEDS